MNTGVKKYNKGKAKAGIVGAALFSIMQFSAAAQEDIAKPEAPSVFTNGLFIALLSIVVIMLIVIFVFADVVKAAAYNKAEKKKEQENSGSISKSFLLLIAFALSGTMFGQNAGSEMKDSSFAGLDATTFYFMILIIFLELIVAIKLYNIAMQLLGVKERKRRAAEEKAASPIKEPTIMDKLNASVSIENEEDILLDHNYDGIRELDNNLPPWWKYGFYVTIIFAFVYIINYHITRTGKLQKAEYDEQIAQGQKDLEEYRKKAANLVDENNATVLTDAASLESGKTVFMDNCAACHGRAGEGGVGPNLTDDYWLHGGGIKDVFKSVKLGWPEKGMKAWQQDLSAKQIHEVSSFIKSIRGTNPPNGKEKQGELYVESSSDSTNVITADSTLINADTLKAGVDSLKK